MRATYFNRPLLLAVTVAVVLPAHASAADRAHASNAQPILTTELIFPLHPQHNHAPGIVELPNGDLLVSWYRGSGERKADDVAIYGARLKRGAKQWSEAFLMVDTPGFPDGNTALFIDSRKRLWLFWPLVLANTWESCLTQYLVSDHYQGKGSPKWEWQGSLFLKPQDFERKMLEGWEHRRTLSSEPPDDFVTPEQVQKVKALIQDKLASRLGWQGRCKPTVLPSGRMLLPLYSDAFSVSLMAITDNEGKTWFASEPLAGFGNIQPIVLRRNNGTLVAYMRENGPLKKVRVSESRDDGVTWGPVGVCNLPNPGSGLDGVRLRNGHWVLIYNDTPEERNSLAVSLSDDEGATWKWTRHLENAPSGSYHYPAIIQGKDGRMQAIYSYFVEGGKSMKHAAFSEEWIRQGDR